MDSHQASLADSNRLASCYTWGWPDDGRLGKGPPEHNPTKKNSAPHEIWPHPNFEFTRSDADVVKSVAGGGRHSLFVMNDGRVMASGWNSHGQCGNKPSQPTYYSPVKVEGLKVAGRDLFVRNVSAAFATSYALTSEGKVYSWGRGKWGALGHEVMEGEDPEEDQWKARIVKELINEKVVDISAGYQHCVCTTFGKRTFAWGRNNHGQLGLGKEAFEAGWVGKPAEIKWRHKSEVVMKFVAGHNHCAALVEITRPDQRVEITAFVWGCPDDGRLSSCDVRMHFVPQEVSMLTTMIRKNHWVFKDISAGGAHTLVLEKYNGLVVGWGQGRYGQLGYGNVWDRPDPVMLVGVRNVIKLSCGARHSMALVDRVTSNDSTDGEVYTWGFNDYGELGMGDCDVRLQPHKVNGLLNADVVQVACGHKHSMCVTSGVAKKVRDLPEYQEYFELMRTEGMLVYDVLKKNMEENGLNPDYLDTPDLILPSQPGIKNVPAEYEGAEPGMQYCIDTIKNVEENEIIRKLRGPYETTYHCVRCKFEHVCLACARHCHGRHPVRVNFKLRHYSNTCQCCEHNICNIRWSNIRHEFDKLALREEDKCISMDQIQEILERLFEDIEQRREGLPLTSKQKEDDLKAAVDAMIDAHKRRVEEEIGDMAELKDLSKKEKDRRKKRGGGGAAGGAGDDIVGSSSSGNNKADATGEVVTKTTKGAVAAAATAEDEEEEEEDIRVFFKDFERWYLEYFRVEDHDGGE